MHPITVGKLTWGRGKIATGDAISGQNERLGGDNIGDLRGEYIVLEGRDDQQRKGGRAAAKPQKKRRLGQCRTQKRGQRGPRK